MIHIFGDQTSIINQFIAEMRDEKIQLDRMRFRRNMERIGECIAYDISKTLSFVDTDIQTPLGLSNVPMLDENVVVATIMRAGLPLHQGVLNIFDNAENSFISAYRKYSKGGTFTIKFEYISSPPIDEKIVILTDPMLATGASMVLAYNALMEKGKPKHVHIVSIVASNEGVEYVRKRLPVESTTLWLGAVDDELTVKAYIVPGLGDAGDLAFGSK